MLYIKKNPYDTNYPITIEDAWDGKIYCDYEDLKELKADIERMLEEKR